MKIYCTICCKEKDRNSEPLAAIHRYKSKRIRDIYEKSRKDGVEFRILSGKFGLLKPHDKISWYNKQLLVVDIPHLKSIIKRQIKESNISELVFFAKNEKEYLDWTPYNNLIKEACSELDTKLKIEYI